MNEIPGPYVNGGGHDGNGMTHVAQSGDSNSVMVGEEYFEDAVAIPYGDIEILDLEGDGMTNESQLQGNGVELVGDHAVPADVSTVTEEYHKLMDKAYKKFRRLRELPAYGRGRWDMYYHKAFHIYARLWKYQQEHRVALVDSGLR